MFLNFFKKFLEKKKPNTVCQEDTKIFFVENYDQFVG